MSFNSNDENKMNDMLDEMLKDFKLDVLTEKQMAWWVANMTTMMEQATAYGANPISVGIMMARFTQLMLGRDAFKRLQNYADELSIQQKAQREATSFPPLPPVNKPENPSNADSRLFKELDSLLNGLDALPE